jgi:hypothetical protein
MSFESVETIVRDARDDAPIIALDFLRSDALIHRDLRKRFPRVIGLWWELDESNKTGWAYSGSNRILAKLIHNPLETQE